MSKKGENIYLRKDGRWEGRYIKGRRPDGRPLYGSIYGKQYSDLKKQLVLRKAEQYKAAASPMIYGDGSMEDWCRYWLEILTRPYVKPETYAGYCRSVERHVLPALGSLKLREITPEHVQTLAAGLQQTLAPSTLRGVCRLIKSIFRSACEKGYISHTPYQDVKLPKQGKRAPRVLTRNEQERLEQEAIQGNHTEYLICLYTGVRVGELCALRWEDIDLENSLMYVRHTVQRIPHEAEAHHTNLVMGSPKSEASVRDIPLPDFLAEMLADQKRQSGPRPEEYLFPGRWEGCCDPRTMQERIKKTCGKLGIPNVHMHTLRHTFATRCLEKGVGYEVLCEFLGHSSPQITLRHYAHCTPEVKRESMNRVGGGFRVTSPAEGSAVSRGQPDRRKR